MTLHSYRLAVLLAAAAVARLCSLLFVPGWWGTPFPLQAAVPVLTGAGGYVRTRVSRR